MGEDPVAQRSRMLNKIADRMEENLEMLAVAETSDNGKPVRETLAADIPLAIDHFRYFAGCIRARRGHSVSWMRLLCRTSFTSPSEWSARLFRGISLS